MNTLSIDMIIVCPKCLMQHIDEPNEDIGWSNPPHRSHLCLNPSCNHIFRVADVCTNGVKELKTKGSKDGFLVFHLISFIPGCPAWNSRNFNRFTVIRRMHQ